MDEMGHLLDVTVTVMYSAFCRIYFVNLMEKNIAVKSIAVVKDKSKSR